MKIKTPESQKLPAQPLSEFEAEVDKIIHGHGDQILRHTVEQYLTRCKFIEYFRGSNNPSEAGGATFAVIAKKD